MYCDCQTTKSAIITGTYKSDSMNAFEIKKQGVRSLLTYDPDYNVNLDKSKAFKIKLNLTSPSFFTISDLFIGHTIFIEPNDSINIALKPIKDIEKRSAKGEFLTKAFTLSTNSKFYGNIIYFDELEKKIGPTIKYKFESPEVYKKKCDNAYKVALNLLNTYKKSRVITDTFYKYAFEDIKARYILWFSEMLIQKDKRKMNVTLFKEIEKLKFNDSTMFFSSDSYYTAPAVFNYYISNYFNPKNYYQNLDKEFATIMSNYTGVIRDRVLGWQIEDYIGRNHPSFDSCYNVFLYECKNEKVKKEVINRVSNFVKPIKYINTISLSALLSRTKIQDPNGNVVELSKVISDTCLTLIDCWATWCIPCKAQIPFLHEIEIEYAGKLKILFLSFDKDETKWQVFLQKDLKQKNQYLVLNSFTSEFSKYFNLESIPRYILISPKGIQVLNENMPLPALKEEFELELKKHL